MRINLLFGSSDEKSIAVSEAKKNDFGEKMLVIGDIQHGSVFLSPC